MEDEEGFPWEDVEAALQDRSSQSIGVAERAAMGPLLDPIREEFLSKGAPESIEWVFFSSPQWTWENLCGRAGWLLIDRDSRRQFSFQMTSMN